MLTQVEIPPDTVTDDDLLRRVRSAAEADALAELIRRYTPMVYAAARRQVRDSALAQDVSQEVLITFMRRVAEIRSAAALGVWLMRTTRYTAANAMRTESRRRRMEYAAMTDRGQPALSSDPVGEAEEE